MATATKTEQVVRHETIILELSPDEARALRDILTRVGGSPKGSRRALTESISEALDGVGFPYLPNRPDLFGNLVFEGV